MNRRGKRWLWALAAVAAIAAGLLVAAGYELRRRGRDLRCREHLRQIGLSIGSDPRFGDKYPDQLADLYPLYSLQIPEPPRSATPRAYLTRPFCPVCAMPYVFRPVTPTGEKLKPCVDDHAHAVAWCPQPCHHGKRAFLFADGGVFLLADDQIEWQSQRWKN
jgi:hypothetical protein